MDQSSTSFNTSGSQSHRNTSSSSSFSTNSSYDSPDNLVNCSISQIINLFTPDNGLVIHKKPVNLVQIVAKTRSYLVEDLFHRLTVHDGSNQDGLRVVKWRRATDQLNLYYGCYVKIFGKVKMENRLTVLMAYHLELITDFNEVTIHCLEVIRDCLRLKKLNQQAEAMEAEDCFKDDLDLGDMDLVSDDSFIGLNRMQLRVISAIRSCPKQEGLTREEIFAAVSSSSSTSSITFTIEQIDEALFFLTTEAHIYTTVDDDHFKSVLDD